MVFLYWAAPRYGHLHVIWFLSLSSVIGSFTVMASKAVSTFLILTIRGIFEGPWSDQISSHSDNISCVAAGHSWYQISPLVNPDAFGCVKVDPPWDAKNNSAGEIIAEGLQQLSEPWLYLSLLVMISTAVLQAPCRTRRPSSAPPRRSARPRLLARCLSEAPPAWW